MARVRAGLSNEPLNAATRATRLATPKLPATRPPAPKPLAPRPALRKYQDAPAPTPIRVSLVDLAHDQCRWPLGDPVADEDFAYCGSPVHPEKPYCAGHCAMAYRGPIVRERARA